MASYKPRALRIAFIHPDLGIGGAERLVVDAAVSLKRKGHKVEFFTSRHDPARCFPETVDGTFPVTVLGNTIPRSVFGGFSILCSMLRQLHLTYLLLLQIYSPRFFLSFLNTLIGMFRFLLFVPSGQQPANSIGLHKIEAFDIYFVDQLSVSIPLIRWFGQRRVIFYCHFPDWLLSGLWDFDVKNNKNEDGAQIVMKKNGNLLMRVIKFLYRLPFDRIEEITTGQADIILANSYFTSKVYLSAFPSLRRPPHVVYPCIDVDAYTAPATKDSQGPDVELIRSDRPTLISLNRFEGKKNVGLAIKAFHGSKKRVIDGKKVRLIIAGGYDDKLPENLHTLSALRELCDKLSLTHTTLHRDSTTSTPDLDVYFLLNFSSAQRTYLLQSPHTIALLYTPRNEHFGIVPVEAMACGVPVLAVNSGGPLETIVDCTQYENGTGVLREPKPEVWSEALDEIIGFDETRRQEIKEAGIKRVKEQFSLETLGSDLDQAAQEAMGEGKPGLEDGLLLLMGTVGFMGAISIVGTVLFVYWPEGWAPLL